MKQLFAFLPTFSILLFFTFCGALNIQYGGSDESPMYKITIFSIGLMGSCVTLWEVLKGNVPYSRSFWIFVIFLPLVIYTMYAVETSFGCLQIHRKNYLLTMAAFSYPCIVSTMYIAEKGFKHFTKWIDVFMLVITMAAYNAIKNSMSGGHIGVGGATYQALSYYCAFAFNLNLCGILFSNQIERFAIFKTEWFGKLSYFLLLVQLVGCFLGGGRGATIYLVLNALLLLVISKRLSRTLMSASVLGSILLVGAKILQETMLSDILGKRIERAFSFIDTEGNVHGEDRFSLYSGAWKYCQDHHLLGGGLFRALEEFGNPHNLFMELLTQGGIVYCLFWIVLLAYVLWRAAWFVKHEHEYYLIPIIAYTLTSLMFSGSYTETASFWFFVVYIIARTERLHGKSPKPSIV